MFKSLKVPYMYDYAEHDTEVRPGTKDSKTKNHGTHVSGIVAGNGKVVGIAPEAQLMFMKMAEDNKDEAEAENILAALDDAVTLGADVINMSFGYTCGFTDEGEQSVNDVYNRINDAGITLAVAAGNAYTCAMGNGLVGKALASNPDTSTVKSPSTYEACTSVASVDNTSKRYFIVDSQKISYDQVNQSTFRNLRVVSGGAINYVVVPNVGNDEDYSGINVTGKVALIEQGSIDLSVQFANAASHGAIGAVIYHNINEEKVILHIENDDNRIPAVFIVPEAGNIMVNAKDKVLHIEEDIISPAGSSSWGVTPDLKLKPEIAAPGEGIYSTLPDNEYGESSGTSMAAPHIAGCFALVKEYLNGKSDQISDVEKAKLANQLLMSTAIPMKNEANVYCSPRKQGSGVVNVLRAVTTDGYLSTEEAVEPKQRPKLNLGDDVNKTGRDISSNASVKFTVDGKNVSSVTLQPKEDVVVDVVIQLEQTAKKYIDDNFINGEFVEGYVFLKSTDTCDLSIPFLGFYGDWTQAPLFDSGSANELQEYQQTVHGLRSEVVVFDKKEDRFFGVNPFDEVADLLYNGKKENWPQAGVDKIAISPNADGNFDSIHYAQLSLLRNAKELKWSITSEDDKVIKSDVINYARKSTTYDGLIKPSKIEDIAFDGRDANGKAIANNETVTFRVKGTLDYSAHEQKNVKDTLSFPITIDIEKPSFVGLSDSADGFKISVKDNQYVSAVELYNKADVSKPVDTILVNEEKKGATTVYNVDLKKLGLSGKQASDFRIKVYDYAMNSTTYDLGTELSKVDGK